MTRINCAYILNADSFDLIYGPQQRAEIAQLCGYEPPFIATDDFDVRAADLTLVDVIISGWGAPTMDDQFLARVPKLRAVLYGAGTVHGFVTAALVERAVLVTSAASANSIPVAEYTVSAIHLSLKGAWRYVKEPSASLHPGNLNSVAGGYTATVGLVSLGAVGTLVATNLARNGLTVLAYDPNISAERAETLNVQLVELDELFQRADVISVHAPLLEATRGMIGRRYLEAMKEGATIVNTSRGAVINQEDLVSMLIRRPDVFAVLDVTEPEPLPVGSPLLTLPSVILTPHIAGSLGTECQRMGELVVEELRRLKDGLPPAHPVQLAGLVL